MTRLEPDLRRWRVSMERKLFAKHDTDEEVCEAQVPRIVGIEEWTQRFILHRDVDPHEVAGTRKIIRDGLFEREN